MGSISSKIESRRCDIVAGIPLPRFPRIFARHARKGTKVTIVSDSAITGRYGRPLLRSLVRAGFPTQIVSVPSGERSKTLQQVGHLYRFLAHAGMERGSWLVALGGGVVGDLTGFVAATYLRGIPFVQIPTTLLAQVDASIGGKTGVDIPEGKNLVGSFYQPRLVWIDPSLLRTLSPAHWRNGLAEVIKYGAIQDRALFEILENKMDRLLRGYSADWKPVIARCARIKITAGSSLLL